METETQLSFVSKEEAHKIIDAIEGEGIFILTYNSKKGISDNGKYINKKKGGKYIDKAKTLVLSKSQVSTLNLHDKLFSDLGKYNTNGKVKTILLPKLEWIPERLFLTNKNKRSIIHIVEKLKKKKPIVSNGVGAPTKIDFFNIHISNST